MSLTTSLRRVSLGFFPTPLEPLQRLSAALDGPQLWIKRDDQTGLAMGGNKVRKLEFLMADAQAQQADTVVTGGAVQSNHARQTAAAAARLGLRAVLVLGGEVPPLHTGNLLLDELLGAEVRFVSKHARDQKMQQTLEELRATGGKPYLIPYGGSNPIGATGYVAAAEELAVQIRTNGLMLHHIVVPSSSGGTQAGLAVGLRALGLDISLHGISIDLDTAHLQARLASLATATASHLGLNYIFKPEEFIVHDAYLGGGYGVMGDLERDAIRTLARHEGVLLDPVYTGRAFGGLLDLIQQSAFTRNENVLFWHTGGTPGLFAYA
ncbi:MAG TPA: D-cysteine desulfhydrase family protein, partial [Anaerolineae bacterium]|nr:D-cysteine desulfhydrase family protein [Anaerolineae bacterium]